MMMMMMMMTTISVDCIIIALLLCSYCCCCYANADTNANANANVNATANGTHSRNNNQALLSLAFSETSVIQQQQSGSNKRLFARSDQQQQPLSGPPKLVQWAKEAVQYYEGSTLVLSCSLATSVSPSGSPVKFAWFKQGKLLINSNSNSQQLASSSSSNSNRLSVETLADYSFFRLSLLKSSDSGAYTCVASNSQGQEDRTTAQVIVNVKLRWLDKQHQSSNNVDDDDSNNNNNNNKQSTFIGGHELITVRAGQPVILECGAAAQPLPRIRWFRLALPPAGLANNQRQQQLSISDGSSFSTNLHHQQQQQQQTIRPLFRMDEAQLRSSLIQQTDEANWISFYRLELATNMDEPRVRGSLSSSSSSSSSIINETMTTAHHIINQRQQWHIETHSSGQHELYSRLILDRADANTNGLYECEASSISSGGAADSNSQPLMTLRSGEQQSLISTTNQNQQTADRLRRLFGVLVNGFLG